MQRDDDQRHRQSLPVWLVCHDDARLPKVLSCATLKLNVFAQNSKIYSTPLDDFSSII